MQRRIILCFLTIFTTTALFSQNGITTPNTDDIIDLSNLTVSEKLSNEVFFKDPENKVYYVDFEATNTKVSQIQLWRNQEELVLNEDTYELPFNTIYELSFDKYGPGEYSIELTTIDDDVIIQLFVIKDTEKEIVDKNKK